MNNLEENATMFIYEQRRATLAEIQALPDCEVAEGPPTEPDDLEEPPLPLPIIRNIGGGNNSRGGGGGGGGGGSKSSGSPTTIPSSLTVHRSSPTPKSSTSSSNSFDLTVCAGIAIIMFIIL